MNDVKASLKYGYSEPLEVGRLSVYIYFNTLPAPMLACGATGEYLDQIAFFGSHAQDDSAFKYRIAFSSVHPCVNRALEDALMQLLGERMWEIFADPEYESTFLSVRSLNSGPVLLTEHRQSYRISDEEAARMLNLLAYNSTFLD